jgi:hypothetical protein
MDTEAERIAWSVKVESIKLMSTTLSALFSAKREQHALIAANLQGTCAAETEQRLREQPGAAPSTRARE